jgi:hypothetical protein
LRVQAVPASPARRTVTVEDLDIDACVRPLDGDRPKHFVGLDECMKACIKVVEENLPKKTMATNPRVPPAMLSRCMRGGKTTVLCQVFDKLKASGKKPIFISFNGDTIIHRAPEENPLDTTLRAIAIALMKEKPTKSNEAKTVKCEESTLDKFLEGKDNIVLLVDELNVLLKPSDTENYADVGRFLRESFLDPSGRHLVFSTHIPESAGIDQLLGKGSGSSRTAIAIEMPTSSEMDKLRGMHSECAALTPCEAVYYSYIPSLIYSVKTQKSFNLQERFKSIPKPLPSAELLATFLREFFNGVQDNTSGAIRAFDSLTDFSAGKVHWVLGYAGLVCDYLGEHKIAEWISQIPSLAQKVESGQDWEAIVLVALALRCIQAKFDEPHEMLMLPNGAPKPADVFLKLVPTKHCERPEDMLKWWKTQAVRKYPYMAVLSPAYAKTTVIDVMWVYTESESSEHIVRHPGQIVRRPPEQGYA